MVRNGWTAYRNHWTTSSEYAAVRPPAGDRAWPRGGGDSGPVLGASQRIVPRACDAEVESFEIRHISRRHGQVVRSCGSRDKRVPQVEVSSSPNVSAGRPKHQDSPVPPSITTPSPAQWRGCRGGRSRAAGRPALRTSQRRRGDRPPAPGAPAGPPAGTGRAPRAGLPYRRRSPLSPRRGRPVRPAA